MNTNVVLHRYVNIGGDTYSNHIVLCSIRQGVCGKFFVDVKCGANGSKLKFDVNMSMDFVSLDEAVKCQESIISDHLSIGYFDITSRDYRFMNLNNPECLTVSLSSPNISCELYPDLSHLLEDEYFKFKDEFFKSKDESFKSKYESFNSKDESFKSKVTTEGLRSNFIELTCINNEELEDHFDQGVTYLVGNVSFKKVRPFVFVYDKNGRLGSFHRSRFVKTS